MVAVRIDAELKKALSSQTAPHTTPTLFAIEARRPGSPSARRRRPDKLPMNQMIVRPPTMRSSVAHSHAIRSLSMARTKSPSAPVGSACALRKMIQCSPSQTTAQIPALAPSFSQIVVPCSAMSPPLRHVFDEVDVLLEHGIVGSEMRLPHDALHQRDVVECRRPQKRERGDDVAFAPQKKDRLRARMSVRVGTNREDDQVLDRLPDANVDDSAAVLRERRVDRCAVEAGEDQAGPAGQAPFDPMRDPPR